ncbi:MAG: hypothetical protein HWD92_02060 [Flavobacteriia bacterium]|nr:hypothetical protein [Flavobacteriia bacterium]
MKALFEKHIENNRLKDIDESEVLLELGQAGYLPALPTLLNYAFKSDDHYAQMHAVQGLLDWDLSAHRELISSELIAVHRDNFFPEWLPGMLPHTRPSRERLEEYYQIGQFISNDRSAGILFGMALSEGGRGLFIRALLDTEWDIADTGVGIHRTARYCAAKLGVKATDIQQMADKLEADSSEVVAVLFRNDDL